MKDDERAVYAFARALHQNHRVDDATYAEAVKQLGQRGVVELVGLLGAAAVCLLAGYAWGGYIPQIPGNFPLIKNLWTSSFVLVTGGWSLVLLAIFYLLIDVIGWQKSACEWCGCQGRGENLSDCVSIDTAMRSGRWTGKRLHGSDS